MPRLSQSTRAGSGSRVESLAPLTYFPCSVCYGLAGLGLALEQNQGSYRKLEVGLRVWKSLGVHRDCALRDGSRYYYDGNDSYHCSYFAAAFYSFF